MLCLANGAFTLNYYVAASPHEFALRLSSFETVDGKTEFTKATASVMY